MSKVISSNIVIGNFLLAAVEKGIHQIKIAELFRFEKLLSPNLNRLDYFTCLCYTDILDFMDTYPFIIKLVNEYEICLTDSYPQQELMNKLNRYFRMGLPKVVVNEIQNALAEMLKDDIKSTIEAKTNSQERIVNNLAHLSTQLLERLNKGMAIAEIDLHNFSIFTRYILQDNIDPETKEYNRLYEKLLDYLRYELSSETDLKRCFSYSCLYSMVVMIQQNCYDNKLKVLAHAAAEEHQQDKDLIKSIKQRPGISVGGLRASFSSDILREQLRKLEEQKIVIYRGYGDERYYILSRFGDFLYEELFSDVDI